jgi:transcriptional regulator with XRE-family HTH domain
LLGVSTVTLSRWELDKVFPTAAYHDLIAKYLGCDPSRGSGEDCGQATNR